MADYLIVNRNNTTYQVELEDKAMIEDTDLLLVNRDGTTYTVAGSEIRRSDFSEVIISPTSITPEVSAQIITASADIPKVGDSVPADVFWNWYLYDASSGDTGKTLVQSTTNREITDTFLLPASAAGKFIGCSVEYLAVTIDETQRCAVGIPPGPVAAMNGLRFDRSRKTRLSMLTDDTIGTTWTFSCWIKPNGQTEPNRLFTIYTPNSSTSAMLRLTSSLKVQCYINSSGANTTDTSTALTENQWNHIVCTVDNGTWSVVINNGTPQDMGTSTNSDNAGSTISIGGFEENSNSNEAINGYLSDVYFVDDVALEPTVFGRLYPEGWGPLDSTVVKTNIANSPVQPYDTRPNYEEEWSAGIVTTTGNVNANQLWGNLFDGNLNDSTTASADQQDARATLTLPNLTWLDSVELYVKSNPPGNQQIRINDANIGATTVHDDYQDVTSYLVGAGITQIQSIAIGDNVGGTATQLNYAAMRIDGRILLDGPADNSQQWSLSVDGVANSSLSEISAIFDGDITTRSAAAIGSSCTFSPGIGTSTWRVDFQKDGPADPLLVNGSSYSVSPATGTGPLNSMSWATTAGNQWVAIYQIEVDGEVLIDAPAQWNISQVWSSTPVNVDTTVVKNAFDGDLSTQCYSDGSSDAYFSISDITATKVECYGFTTDGTFYVDGSSKYEVSCNAGWVEVYNGTATTVNKLGFTRAGASGGGHSAWRIDGKILVDQGTFGTNGFYLPFDTSEDGENYSYYFDATSGLDSKDVLFDGDITDGYFIGPQSSVGTFTGTLTPPTPIPCTSLRVYVSVDQSNVTGAVSVNGETDVTFNGTGWHTITPPQSGEITTLELRRVSTSVSNNQFDYSAIEVNGRILVNHNNVGVEKSGNNFIFKDTGLAVGNSSQVWSGNFSSTPDFNTNDTAHRAFDGIDTTYANEQGGGALMNFVAPITGNYEVYMYTNGNQRLLKVDGNTVVTVTNGASPDWYDIGSVTAGQTIAIDGQTYTGGAFVYEWRVDGITLIDGNLADSLSDTPMNNYAIISSNTGVENGNLLANNVGGAGFTPVSTILFASGGKYYVEGLQTSDSYNIHITLAQNIWNSSDGTTSGNWSSGVNFGGKNGDIIGAAIDVDANEIDVYKNGVLQGTATYNESLVGKSIAFLGGNSAKINTNYGQQIYAYPAPAGYTGLYQSWSQWVIQTLISDVAEADALRTMLVTHADTYSAGADYCEGSVIKAFGELWIAVNDAPATTFTTIADAIAHVNWARLNVSA